MQKKNRKKLFAVLISTAIFCSLSRVWKEMSYNSVYSKKYPLIDASYESIIDNSFNIDELGTYVPQGICVLDECYLISLYDSEHKNNSIMLVMDIDGNIIHKSILDNKAHVGGIGYDPVNSLVWVAGRLGTVNAYKLDDILNNECAKACYDNLYVGFDLINYLSDHAVSFLTINDNKLYVGSYTLIDSGIMKEYEIVCCDDECELKLLNTVSIPDKVQGVSFFEDNGKSYIIFSRSYGKYNSSVLDICLYDSEITSYIDESVYHSIYKMEPMLEQVYVTSDNNIFMVHETNAIIYKGKNCTDEVYVANLNNVLKLKK